MSVEILQSLTSKLLMNTTLLILDCIAISIGAGLIYGIFGGGSGLIMMPGFYYLLHHFALSEDYQMQVAIATTAAVSVLLGISATQVQWRNHLIDFNIFKKIAPGLLIGTFLAISLLNIIRSAYLKRLFGFFVILVAVWLGFYRSKQDKKIWSLSSSYNHILSTIIGFLWFLLGIAVFTVPYLYKCGIDLRRSIGCATLTSTVFSGIAAVLLIFTGLFQVGFSNEHIGFVNLPLSALAIIPSAISAHFGSKISIKLSKSHLKIIYVVLLYAIGFLMLL
ncbi:MAG: sulfite exporter TauE/SafE family protein [Coxiella-like endosymbiont]